MVSLLGLVGCSVPFSFSSASQPKVSSDLQVLPITATLQVGKEIIELEVATTPEQQQQGLMYRTSLAKNRGMLFPFDPPRVPRFWMKNTLISLDMIFLNGGQIKAILSNIPPCTLDPCPTYGPSIIVDHVLELPAGRAQELGLEVGDRLNIQPLNSSP